METVSAYAARRVCFFLFAQLPHLSAHMNKYLVLWYLSVVHKLVNLPVAQLLHLYAQSSSLNTWPQVVDRERDLAFSSQASGDSPARSHPASSAHNSGLKHLCDPSPVCSERGLLHFWQIVLGAVLEEPGGGRKRPRSRAGDRSRSTSAFESRFWHSNNDKMHRHPASLEVTVRRHARGKGGMGVVEGAQHCAAHSTAQAQ